jgi:hypothetical protein
MEKGETDISVEFTVFREIEVALIDMPDPNENLVFRLSVW